jgi:hypothetical protein
VLKCYYGSVRSFEPAVMPPTIQTLRTPPVARIVPDGVFDAFAWCVSDRLEWRRPRGPWDTETPIDASNPERMVFVLHSHLAAADRELWPRELARLHVTALGLGEDEALAPWAIDDATDRLYEHGTRPRDVFWLAADSLRALFWGLHDWGHFHSHGPFEQVAWTELQCDATALAWLWANRGRLELGEATWQRALLEVATVCRERFDAEGVPFVEGALAAERVQALLPARTTRS